MDELKLFGFDHFRIAGKEFMVSRSGYTGEDGFEIYGSNADILALFRELAEEPEVSLCGLGCRDTLRFEAAMPLYGHEIGPEINPLAAGLGFAVNLEKDFIGSEALKKIKAEGPKERIVALELKDRALPAKAMKSWPTAKQSAGSRRAIFCREGDGARVCLGQGRIFGNRDGSRREDQEKLGSGSRAEQEILKEIYSLGGNMSKVLENLLYSKSHEWCLVKGLRKWNH